MQPAVARILDANANRAREALRVVEEFVRFDLEDARLVERIKTLRHELSTLVRWPSMARLAVARDAAGDVGRTVETESEFHRADARAVASASMSRVTEALRALEEYSKPVDVDFARAIEALRYRTYDLEKAVKIRWDARDRLHACRLCVIVTESLCHSHWLDTARRVLDGGANAVQLREKKLTDRALLDRATTLAELCRDAGALFFVNDRADIARMSAAAGLHLGQNDAPLARVRRFLGTETLVGVSTHTADEVKRAADENPSYIAVGPVFQSTTKPQDHVAGVATVAAAQATTSLPIWAIGGITQGNIGEVLAAGATCICVCSAVISQPSPERAVQALRKRMNETPCGT